MHGLRLEIQQRYFSIELLLHGFGTAAEELEALAGSTRHFWGQKWIQISGQGIGYHREGQKRSRRMVRRIARIWSEYRSEDCLFLKCKET